MTRCSGSSLQLYGSDTTLEVNGIKDGDVLSLELKTLSGKGNTSALKATSTVLPPVEKQRSPHVEVQINSVVPAKIHARCKIRIESLIEHAMNPFFRFPNNWTLKPEIIQMYKQMDRKEDLHNMVFAITLFPKQSVAFNKARILGKIHLDLSSLFIQRPDNLDKAAFEGKEQPKLLPLFPPAWRLRCTNWAEEPKHLLEEEIEDKDVAVVKVNDSEDPIEDGKVVRSLADELLGIVLEEDMLLHLEYRAVVYRGRLNLQVKLLLQAWKASIGWNSVQALNSM